MDQQVEAERIPLNLRSAKAIVLYLWHGCSSLSMWTWKVERSLCFFVLCGSSSYWISEAAKDAFSLLPWSSHHSPLEYAASEDKGFPRGQRSLVGYSP